MKDKFLQAHSNAIAFFKSPNIRKIRTRLNWARHRTALVLRYYFKRITNKTYGFIGKDAPYEITLKDRMAAIDSAGFPNAQLARCRNWFIWGFHETVIGWSILIFMTLYFIVQFFGPDVGAENLWTEFWGLIFDVLIILIGFGFIQYRRSKQEEITRQHELIEDFKRWDSEEARLRIIGAIRRLNRKGILKVNLTAAKLKHVRFLKNGINSLEGSHLSGASAFEETYYASRFENVDFSQLNCRDVTFHVTEILDGVNLTQPAKYKDCTFFDADLRDSRFDGAELIWSYLPVDSLYEEVGTDTNGIPINAKVHAEGFNDADLTGVTFQFCRFVNADFREAVNIKKADFFRAEGLKTCVFDDDETKEWVLENAAREEE